MPIDERHDEADRAINAVLSVLDPITGRLRRLALISATAAIVFTFAFTGRWIIDGGVATVATLIILALTLVPAFVLRLLVGQLEGTADDVRKASRALRTWTDGSVRRERIAALRRQAAEVRASPRRIAQILAALRLVRDVRRELGDLGPGALLSPRNLLSGYLGMMSIAIGIGGTLVLCWVAVLMTFIRLAAELT